jgi:CRP/FNR family transcriptional regulator
MTVQQRLDALGRTELFGALPAEAQQELANAARERRLSQGQILFSAGESATGLFVVVVGTLRAYRQTREGREQTIHVEGPGATLAEVPMFDGGPYPSTVQAEDDAILLFVPQRTIWSVLMKNPAAAVAALKLMARRLRKVSDLAEQLALRDVAQRLAAMLAEEASRVAGELRDGASFPLPPHQSIAARLGSVREVITRRLHKLIDDGVISVHSHTIVVLNASALRARATLE